MKNLVEQNMANALKVINELRSIKRLHSTTMYKIVKDDVLLEALLPICISWAFKSLDQSKQHTMVYVSKYTADSIQQNNSIPDAGLTFGIEYNANKQLRLIPLFKGDFRKQLISASSR